MSRSLELPDDVYADLEGAARRDGLTPAGWIASTLAGRSSAPEQRPPDELLEGCSVWLTVPTGRPAARRRQSARAHNLPGWRSFPHRQFDPRLAPAFFGPA
jgi:hypothetical protein